MIPRQKFDIPLAGGRVLELGRRPLVMGILNVTPDSFSEFQPTTIRSRALFVGLSAVVSEYLAVLSKI